MDVYRTSETDERARTPSELVIAAIATKEGCDPLELEAPLFEGIDPDGLNTVLAGDDAKHETYVGFTLLGHGVQIHGDGTVYVDGDQFDPVSGTLQS